jgi:hypothetical protein
MFRTNAAIGALFLAASLWSATASADVIDVYSINGSYSDFGTHSITGTLTVDLTTKSVTAADVFTGSTFGGFGEFNLITAQGSEGRRNYSVDLTNALATLNLVIASKSTLFGGTSSTIDPGSEFFALSFFPCFTCGEITGTLTLDPRGTGVAAAVPESSTWAMMILGFFALGLMAYRGRNGTLRAAEIAHN